MDVQQKQIKGFEKWGPGAEEPVKKRKPFAKIYFVGKDAKGQDTKVEVGVLWRNKAKSGAFYDKLAFMNGSLLVYYNE